MKRVGLGLLIALCLPLSGFAFEEKIMITGSGSCVDTNGLEMEGVTGSQARFACFQNKAVQKTCDLDGRMARLNAYRQWMDRLDQFQRACDKRGGTFSYQSAAFQEPRDESFCTSPDVSIQYGQFENAICQFESRCPAIPVICRSESDGLPYVQSEVFLPGVPGPVHLR